MAIPDSPRVIYQRSPLAEVTAQLRFPPILKIDSEPPAAFQETIRSEYPKYTDALPQAALPANLPPQIANLIQGFGVNRTGGARYQFTSQDDKWQAVLTREILELKTSSYGRWEEFRGRLGKLHESLEAAYKPAAYVRVGLKYVDIIRRSSLGLTNTPWSELLKPFVAGELSTQELADRIDSASRQSHFRLDDTNCFVTLKTGIALAEPDKEKCFMIDGDFHTHGRTETTNVLTILDGFNRTAGQLFRWCIQERLHNALEPQSVGGRR